MPHRAVRLFSFVCLLTGVLMLGGAVATAQTGSGATTGNVVIDNIGAELNANPAMRYDALASEYLRTLFDETPQLTAIQRDIVLGPFEIDPPVGVCEISLNTLASLGANTTLLDTLQVPNELALWRLLNAPASDPRWIPVGYAYNPISNSMIFQCVDRATYVLYRGTNEMSFNGGLSDAGTYPARPAQVSHWLGVIGVLLLAIGAISRDASTRTEA